MTANKILLLPILFLTACSLVNNYKKSDNNLSKTQKTTNQNTGLTKINLNRTPKAPVQVEEPDQFYSIDSDGTCTANLTEKYISLMQNLSIYPVTNSDDVEKNYDRSEFQSRLCRNFFKSFIKHSSCRASYNGQRFRIKLQALYNLCQTNELLLEDLLSEEDFPDLKNRPQIQELRICQLSVLQTYFQFMKNVIEVQKNQQLSVYRAIEMKSQCQDLKYEISSGCVYRNADNQIIEINKNNQLLTKTCELLQKGNEL